MPNELTAIVADNKGKFILSLAAELVPENEDDAAAPGDGTGTPAPGTGNDPGATGNGGFGGPGHGAVDFGSGAEPQLKLMLPMGGSLAVITASLRKRGKDGRDDFAGGAHGGVDFGSGSSGAPLTLEFPVSLIFSDE